MIAPNDGLVDKEQIQILKQLFNVKFLEFVNTYFFDFECKEKDLSSAVKEKKFDSISRIAHSLKGSSLNMGALGLANACLQIEVASKRQRIEDVVQEYEELCKLYPKTKEIYVKLST